MTQTIPSGFSDLGLSEPVLKALAEIGYESPSPIQEQIIPHVLAGRDVIGQAQTGTGKTAAFALPLLTRVGAPAGGPGILVLTPTRELAIQVSEAFQRYAMRIKDFHVLPIYGGQGYEGQLRQLKRGTNAVVGTPGRVMDHMRRGSLSLSGLQCLVLDEADEMLRMGFIEDVEWILEQTPAGRQIALFSATMPAPIRRIAERHLNDPVSVSIQVRSAGAETIRQRYWMVSGLHKLDALTRLLEGEPFEGMIVFVRTKTATEELSEKLNARGFASAPLNGDIPQSRREQTVNKFKKGKLDILVATDVAARGLDVERVSHVVNYDIPNDPEAYVHRIGRTGRAGRRGEAIMFAAPRERRMLRLIEKTTRQTMELMTLPAVETINNMRIARFKERIADVLAQEDLGFFYQLVEDYQRERNVPAIEIAAALAKMAQGDEPMLLNERTETPEEDWSAPRPSKPGKKIRQKRDNGGPEAGMERYRFEAGHNDGVMPNHVVGAIANETGLDSAYIGRIRIHDDFGTVDLPEGLPAGMLNHMKKIRVAGKPMNLSLAEKSGKKPERNGSRFKTSEKPLRAKAKRAVRKDNRD